MSTTDLTYNQQVSRQHCRRFAMMILRILSFLLGLTIVAATMLSAIRTFVLPRSAPSFLTGIVFMSIRRLLEAPLHWLPDYQTRDRLMAFYAPISLLALLPVWLIVVNVGYTLMFWGSGISSWGKAFTISGSSLLTLGFARGDTFFQTLLAFSAATIGLILVALLIAYIPTMYNAFSRRELAVTLLEVGAGTPPSAVEMLKRFYRIGGLERLRSSWTTWETWFADIEESHTSLAALVFFRSPQSDHSWITAAGTVLDAAALTLAVVDVPREPQAALCLRAGYLSLRRISDFFRITYNKNARFPDDAISITREEFNAACAELANEGLPMKPDLDQAWQDFGGWRVNYDATLLALCRLTMAPPARWSSDRAFDGSSNARGRT